jgi:hypothetical protein
MQKTPGQNRFEISERLSNKNVLNSDFSIESNQKYRVVRGNPIFRIQPKEVTEIQAREMIVKNDFYDKNRNKESRGFNSQFEMLQSSNEGLIFDHVSGLMWQQQGSLEAMSFDQARLWVEELNRIKYVDFQDWRLPTLEEAMSLMKKEQQNGNLFNNNLFGRKQTGIWTCDSTENGILAWVVFFNYGSCYINCFDLMNYVRAVRWG